MPLEVQPEPVPLALAPDSFEIAPVSLAGPRRMTILARLEARALLVVAVCAVAIMSFAGIPAHLSQDGWLALVAGRIIAQHGIPQHDYLTVMAHGVRWVDQQWLAQLWMYGLQQLGGLALMTVFYVSLTTVAFGGAIVAAARLGGSDRYIVRILPVGAFFYLATAVSIRTQGFAYPLFVATLWLLAAEARHRTSSARVYWVFPILVVWANLHGSVTLGVGMVVLYGLTVLVAGFRRAGLRGLLDRRGAALVFVSPLTLLATPYGTAIIGYYRSTLFNPAFGKLVSEWQPVTGIMLLAVPLLLVIVAAIWILGRSGSRTPPFEHLLLVILGLGAIDAVRNITWFGLALVILLPATLSQMRPLRGRAGRHRRLDRTLALAALALTLMAVIVTLGRPARWFESTYPQRAVTAVERIVAAQPNAKVFADVRYADWLLWHAPALAGHLAYDTSFELLSVRQLTQLNSLAETVVPGVGDPIGPYSALVLYPKNRTVNKILLSRPGTRVVLRNPRVIVATKPAR
jgi:hypothetical protein